MQANVPAFMSELYHGWTVAQMQDLISTFEAKRVQSPDNWENLKALVECKAYLPVLVAEELRAKFPIEIVGESFHERLARKRQAACEGFDLDAQEPVTPGYGHYHQGAHCHCRY